MGIKKYLPAVGIAIFVYLLFKLDITNILNEIKNADLFFLFIALFLVFVSFFTSTLKWFFIARKQNINVSFNQAIKMNLMSGFYGFVTPSRIGSVIRVEYLRNINNNHVGKAASNYALEKIFDLSSLLILMIISGLVLRNILSISYFYYALGGFLAILILIFTFRDRERAKSILKIFYIKFLPKKIKESAKDGFYSFYESLPERKYFAGFLALSLLNWVILYSIFFFIGMSVGIKTSFFYFLLFMPIVTFIGQIPITINGLGTREAAMISLFGFIGISATKIFSMSLINLVINGIFPAIIGMLLILYNKESHGGKD